MEQSATGEMNGRKGISIHSALRIFLGPKDLVISTAREPGGTGKYGVAISYGSNTHNCKTLIHSGFIFDDRESSIPKAKELLERVVKVASTPLKDLILEKGGVLNQEHIDRIIHEMTVMGRRIVSTRLILREAPVIAPAEPVLA